MTVEEGEKLREVECTFKRIELDIRDIISVVTYNDIIRNTYLMDCIKDRLCKRYMQKARESGVEEFVKKEDLKIDITEASFYVNHVGSNVTTSYQLQVLPAFINVMSRVY